MIPIKFLIIFRELSITQCLRSHRHRQHLWHILMLHPYTLTLLPLESQKHRATPRKEIRCRAGVAEVGKAWERTGRLRDSGRLSLWHGKEPARGGGEGWIVTLGWNHVSPIPRARTGVQRWRRETPLYSQSQSSHSKQRGGAESEIK